MENDILNTIWSSQNDNAIIDPKTVIGKAKKQRRRQYWSVLIMSLTVIILIGYTIFVSPKHWNNFSLGLLLMISSLVFRIILELTTIHLKESKLISLDSKSYKNYLKKHYQLRLWVHYVVTPICLATYIYGFYLLLPYFKREFSEGFYLYCLISGFGSITVIIGIIIHSIRKELRFLDKLKHH
jgi:NhaP-type Na+/H+ or K+/H+ antiporter